MGIWCRGDLAGRPTHTRGDRGIRKGQLQRGSLSTLRRIRRRFDAARTPFARLCETGVLPSEQEQALCQLQQSTNPRLLRRQIYAQIERLSHLPNATPGITEDVHDTLTFPLSFWKGGGSLK